MYKVWLLLQCPLLSTAKINNWVMHVSHTAIQRGPQDATFHPGRVHWNSTVDLVSLAMKESHFVSNSLNIQVNTRFNSSLGFELKERYLD